MENNAPCIVPRNCTFSRFKLTVTKKKLVKERESANEFVFTFSKKKFFPLPDEIPCLEQFQDF